MYIPHRLYPPKVWLKIRRNPTSGLRQNRVAMFLALLGGIEA
jgi:hypothetical protein